MNKKYIWAIIAVVALLVVFLVIGPASEKQVIAPDLSKYASASTTSGLSTSLAALSKDSKDVSAWMNFAMNRKGAGDYEAARQAWEYAAVLSPDYFVPFNNLGDLYHYFLKDYKQAEKNLLRVIELDPTYVAGYGNLFDLYHLSYKKDTEAAEKVLLRGLDNVTNDISLLSRLGDYYKEKGRLAEARTYYQKALEEAVRLKDSGVQAFLNQMLLTLPAAN